MTIKEAIDKADGLNPNQYDDVIKVSWLSNLDWQIHNDVLKEHEPVPESEFVPYDINDLERELLVKEPFDELYLSFLDMKVDEANRETARYNNSLAFFNAKYQAFAQHYHKTHTPVLKAKFRLW